MRYSFLGLILSLVLLAAPLHAADTKKAPPADVGPGRIAWFDLATTDLAKSKEFYSKLFGWTFAPVAYTDLAAEIVSDKTPIGTLRTADGVVMVVRNGSDAPATIAATRGPNNSANVAALTPASSSVSCSSAAASRSGSLSPAACSVSSTPTGWTM